ncbi:MAG: imidazole glycerol phosphate synthase subunit HisH [Verrucomicrobiota bacterium]
MKVLIINYGMGNLGSVRRAFEECGADVLVSENPTDAAGAEHIVLPGVGAFADGMARLNAAGWPEKIRETLKNPGVHFLGICLGMQLLADKGHEGGETAGLGLIHGEVKRLQPVAGERIPHVGWNEVCRARPSPLLDGIQDDTDFYFVHSYHFLPARNETVLATTPYGGGFVSVTGLRNVFGTQFHPEKSSRPGFQLLKNFLALKPT